MIWPKSRAERLTITSTTNSVVSTVTDQSNVRQSSPLYDRELSSDRRITQLETRPAYTNINTFPPPNQSELYHHPNVNPFGEIISRRSYLTSTSTHVTQASTEQYRSQYSPTGNSDIIRKLLLGNPRTTPLQTVSSDNKVAEIVNLLQGKTQTNIHKPKLSVSVASSETFRNPGITQQQFVQTAKVQEAQNIRRQLLLLQHKQKIQEELKRQKKEQLSLSGVPGQYIVTGTPTRIVTGTLSRIAAPTGQFIQSVSRQYTLPGVTEGSIELVDIPSPITAGYQATDRQQEPAGNMDSHLQFTSELSPFINTCGELPLSTDFIDASIYASSPNSLHLYEQEKIDMQCSMGVNTTCSTFDPNTLPDDFELKAQYENSQDISNLPFVDSLPVSKCGLGGRVPSTNSSLVDWEPCVKSASDVYIKSESPGMPAPTLAELNSPTFDMYLDDIDSYISFEMNTSVSDISHGSETIVKTEQCSTGVDTKSMYSTLNRSHAESTGTASVSNDQFMQKLPVTVVKTEPIESSTSLAACSPQQKTFTQLSTAVKPEHMTVKRALERPPLRTICEIDISDATTLQRLLSSKSPLQARVPRKRTISEPQTSSRSISSRKRSFDSTGLDMDKKWEEIKQFLHTETENAGEITVSIPTPTVKRERTRYDSTSSIMTLTSTEDDDSDSDKDFDDDSDSDMEGGHDISSLSPANSLIRTKEKQYFWQYNVQSKGPKGTRAKFDLEEDPHVLNDFEDPVFGTNSGGNLNTSGISIKHGGKARKGDGNDIVPSPKKLCQIGLQLRKINRQINDFIPVSELPSQARGKTRKEKNKLASRACRLKKKAQHEANKVKLHGLETEHRKLLTVIHLIRHKLYEYIKHRTAADDNQCMTDVLQSLVETHLTEMVAGHATDYVNSVIHKVEEGNYTGGLNIQATRSYPKELHN